MFYTLKRYSTIIRAIKTDLNDQVSNLHSHRLTVGPHQSSHPFSCKISKFKAEILFHVSGRTIAGNSRNLSVNQICVCLPGGARETLSPHGSWQCSPWMAMTYGDGKMLEK